MTTKKATRISRTSPGRKSKKRTGIVTQSIRIPVVDNRLLHRAAKLGRSSFNSWAVNALVLAAQNVVNLHAAKLKEKTIG